MTLKNKKVLIIGFVWPEPKSSAAGSRMLQLIELFNEHGCDITYVSTAIRTEQSFSLVDWGVSVDNILLNDASFDDYILKLQPDIVMFDRFMTEEQFGWRVAKHCPNALRILDTEDLHSLRFGRQKAYKDNVPFDKSYLFNDMAKRELASIYRSDLSLIISEAEMKLLLKEFKVDKNLIYYLPFLQPKILFEQFQELPGFEVREHFMTIGNFLHEPNYNSAVHIKNHIWPNIRKQLPKAEMHLYGAYASQKVLQLHNPKEGFLVKGFAEDVNIAIQKYRVCLAPLQFGAGLKGKLIDAMHNGTPCVMSSIAAEGMFGELEPNGYIEDSPEEFADKAVNLYKSQTLWKDFMFNGVEIINKRFNVEKLKPEFISAIESLLNNLQQHRLNNFMGTMLQHHTMQSTKFMAKWIEAKNKL